MYVLAKYNCTGKYKQHYWCKKGLRYFSDISLEWNLIKSQFLPTLYYSYFGRRRFNLGIAIYQDICTYLNFIKFERVN